MSESDPAVLPPAAPEWRPLTRAGFRLSFAYLMLYALVNGNATVLSFIPFVQGWLTTPFSASCPWIGQHVFHLTGIAARWHGGGSGDTAMNYVFVFLLLAIALGAALIWSVLDGRRPHYSLLLAWLRFVLRLTVGVGMLVYGFAKLFPLQMREPTFAILNNTYGNSSPMTLLWTLIGLHPGYERVCGLAEVVGGVLLLYRRTATLGALFSAFVVANIVLYNFFFDVPVKIYSGHLLLMSLYLLLPELAALWGFFVLHRPAVLTATWVPPASRRPFRIATRVIEGVVLGGICLALIFSDEKGWIARRKASEPTPLLGAWQIDSVVTANPKASPVSPEGQPWVALYIDDRREGFYRSADGALWRCGLQYDEAKHRLGVHAPAIKGADYEWSLPDPAHLELKRLVDKQPVKILLHRLPAPERYALTERKFSWINEWGYER